MEKQAELIESLENIAQEMEPKMQQATKAAQLIDMLDQANARFDEIRDEVWKKDKQINKFSQKLKKSICKSYNVIL